jgi:integrase/recombinase XerD
MIGVYKEALFHLPARFFTERLITQQGASSYTVAGYSDTFCLLLQFAKERLGRAPSALRIEDLNAEFLEAFLEHLEHDRGNRPRTRNRKRQFIPTFKSYK